MAPIAQDTMRCEKLSQRQQAYLIPGFNETIHFFEDSDNKQVEENVADINPLVQERNFYKTFRFKK